MRNIPIPVDTSRLTFVCVTAPRPRLVSQETGEIKTDKQGRTVYQVGLPAADVTGRMAHVRAREHRMCAERIREHLFRL